MDFTEEIYRFLLDIQENALNAIIYLFVFILIGISIKLVSNKILSMVDEGEKIFVSRIFKIIYAILVLLSIQVLFMKLGFNIEEFFAAFGIVGVFISYVLRGYLASIVMWINSMMNNDINIGDKVKFRNIQGKIIRIGIKYIYIQEKEKMHLIPTAVFYSEELIIEYKGSNYFSNILKN